MSSKRYPSRLESRAGFFASTRDECPFELRRKAGHFSRVTAGPIDLIYRVSCPPARGPCSGRAEEGWHFLAGPRVASLAPGHSDSALTDRHQMLFRAALRSARRFRFSIDRRKPGRGESVDVTSPQPQARGWGPGGDGCQTVRIWSFANRGGWGNVTSPRVSLPAQQS